jgi:hypothetical protein
LAHSVNTHPGKTAQPDETITRLENKWEGDAADDTKKI